MKHFMKQLFFFEVINIFLENFNVQFIWTEFISLLKEEDWFEMWLETDYLDSEYIFPWLTLKKDFFNEFLKRD